MTEMRRFVLKDLLLLLVVVAVAAAARVGYLVRYCDGARTAGPYLVESPSTRLDIPSQADLGGLDRTELGTLVYNLEKHQWFGSLAPFGHKDERGNEVEEQTAHVSPGYPWLLALLAKLTGTDDLARCTRWLQALLGTATAALYFLFARRAFRSLAVATVAGLLAALHPFWVIDTASLTDGPLTTFLLALVLCLGATAIQTSGAFASLLFGLALAGTALVRAALLPFAFVALIWFLLRSRTEARGWLCALLAFLGFANGLAPWTVRNYQVFGEPVPIVDSVYLHLWYGNNPEATGGAPTEAMLQKLPEEKRKELEKVPAAEQPRRYNKLAGLVADEMRDHPFRTMRRRADAFDRFFVSERYFSDEQVAAPTGEGPPIRGVQSVLLASLLAMLGLAFLGWRWGYAWRKESMPASLAMIWLPLPYILGHADALHGPRLPLDGVLLTFAAVGLVGLVPGVGTRLREGQAPPPEGEEMAEPLPDAHGEPAVDATHMGTAVPQPGQRPGSWR
jgi:4-amino-4-deoxy-L-arabinose transferase-like glycosyltransferase